MRVHLNCVAVIVLVLSAATCTHAAVYYGVTHREVIAGAGFGGGFGSYQSAARATTGFWTRTVDANFSNAGGSAGASTSQTSVINYAGVTVEGSGTVFAFPAGYLGRSVSSLTVNFMLGQDTPYFGTGDITYSGGSLTGEVSLYDDGSNFYSFSGPGILPAGNYTFYVELQFDAVPVSGGGTESLEYDLQLALPEPVSIVPLGLGLTALLLRRRTI